MAAVGRHRHAHDAPRMAFERADRLTALQVPEPQRSVPRTRDNIATVGRCRHGADLAHKNFKHPDGLTALQVPEPQRSVSRT